MGPACLSPGHRRHLRVFPQDCPYRSAVLVEEAFEIKREWGEKLCPRCVDALDDLVSKGKL